MDLYKKIASLPPEKRELFELMLMEQGVDLSQVMIVPQDRKTTQFPLSYSQQRLWFLDQLEPNSSLYNIAPALRLKGKLNEDALHKSFNEIVRRHEVLRTAFDKKGKEPIQVIADSLDLKIKHIKIDQSDPQQTKQTVEALVQKESLTPFNLSTGPLIHLSLIKISDENHVLVLTKHHIVSDNWSTGLMVHEIIQLYTAFSQNKPSPLPELSVQYADFAYWQRKWLSGKTLENQVSYWRDQLAGAPPILDMPLDKSRPSYQTYNGDYKTFSIDKDTTKAINQLSRELDTTSFMTLIAAFYILLYRYSGQDDICIGSPIANRNRKEIEPMIGFFINTLILRGDLSENPSFKTLIQRVKEMTLGAYANQDIPFEILVEELQPEREMSHSPFFQVMFVMNNARIEKLELPGLELSLMEVENKTSKFELILNITEAGDKLDCKFEYNTDLYNPETIDRLIEHYNILLQSIISNPETSISELPLLAEKEKSLLLNQWAESGKSYNENSGIIELFEQQVRQTPTAIALRFNDESYTYQEINLQMDRMASYLLQKGLKNGQIVGVCADRSSKLLVSLLAILKTGGVYLPLDPAYPQDRLQYMIDDSGAKILLTETKLASKFNSDKLYSIFIDQDWDTITNSKPGLIENNVQLKDVAYIIYTSGSTGKPKGVEIQHCVLANHCCDMRDYYELSVDDNVLQFAALNFDASLEQILTPLISGATLVMRDVDIWDTQVFTQNIEKYDLTVINPPTAYWAQLASDWSQKSVSLPENHLRLVIVGGDVLKPDALKAWLNTPLRDIRLLNAYGPTETVITASTYPVPADFNGQKMPIGKPRANRSFYVLDSQMQPVPIGVPGELYIGGNALAKGYLNRQKLTTERFIKNPFVDDLKQRMYKTGDRVRFLTDGNLEFLGRVDFQIKIRGFRIELGEIESRLGTHPDIDTCILTAVADPMGNNRIVAYYTAKEALSISTLRDFMEEQLPDYMIPSVFTKLEEMPLDPSGKISRRLLPMPDFSRIQVETEFIHPRTETEKILVGIVKEILQIERVGVKDSFFDLGGQSMMATQVVSRIREEFNMELSLRAMFERPTVEGIALSITEIQAGFEDSEDLDAMLDEIEDLSDEELKELLNSE